MSRSLLEVLDSRVDGDRRAIDSDVVQSIAISQHSFAIHQSIPSNPGKTSSHAGRRRSQSICQLVMVRRQLQAIRSRAESAARTRGVYRARIVEHRSLALVRAASPYSFISQARCCKKTSRHRRTIVVRGRWSWGWRLRLLRCSKAECVLRAVERDPLKSSWQNEWKRGRRVTV